MKYRITARTASGIKTYFETGTLSTLLDAAYDRGALGVTAMVQQ